jgi:hypothetical protein
VRRTPADLELLRRWDEQEHVVAADPNDDWAWEVELARHPDWREQLIDPRREETHYWGDVPANLRAIDIWIGDQADLGKGWGTSIMSAVIERCFADAFRLSGAHRSAREQRARAALLRAHGFPVRATGALRRRRLFRLPTDTE